jgi:signal peptidase II
MVAAGVLAVDQLTKALVRGGITRGEEDPVLPGIRLVHVRNDGVAFGLLGGAGGVVVAIVVVAALLALLTYFATHADRPLAWLPTGLLLGGAAGNVIDRLRDGAVTDWIDLPAWPAFNIADVGITFGVIILLLVLGDEERDAARRRR